MSMTLNEVQESAEMILFEHLDIRAVTLGVNLKDLIRPNADELSAACEERLAAGAAGWSNRPRGCPRIWACPSSTSGCP